MKTIRELVEIAEAKPNEDLQTAQWLVATSHPDAIERKAVEHTIIKRLADKLTNMPCSLTLMTENLGDLFSWQIEHCEPSIGDPWNRLRQDWLKQYPDAGRQNTQIPSAVVDNFNVHIDNSGCHWQVNTPWLAKHNLSLGTIQINAIQRKIVSINGQLADLTSAGWKKLANWLVEQGVHVEMVKYGPGEECNHLSLTCHQPAKFVVKNKFLRRY